MFATTVFAMGDTQDMQEEQTQSTQQVCRDEDLPQWVSYRETNLPAFDEDATEDVRSFSPDEYVQSEEGFVQDSQLQASIEDGSQAQLFANQIAAFKTRDTIRWCMIRRFGSIKTMDWDLLRMESPAQRYQRDW